MRDKEIWKRVDIEGSYPYEISNYGRVMALPKVVKYSDGRKRKYKRSLLSQRVDGKGYHFVSIFFYDKTAVQIRTHQLVSKAFLSNPEDKPCINHKDSDRQNNYYKNLEWCTYSENIRHGISEGNIYKPGSKIYEKDVLAIRSMYNEGSATQYQIAEMYSLGQAQISRIVNFKNWK